ncbi:VOC family protein [Streptomyces sp. NPDC047082]
MTGLGASVLARHDGRTVPADPEGNEFCLFGAGRNGAEGVRAEGVSRVPR